MPNLGRCHVCARMGTNPNKYDEVLQGAEFCRLCKRPYCFTHKSTTEKEAHVCEINHVTYVKNHAKVMNGETIFRSLEARREELGEDGVRKEEERLGRLEGEVVSGEDSDAGEVDGGGVV